MLRPIFRSLTLALALLAVSSFVTTLRATPYASNVSISGTTVNFILNENADSLSYTINNGSPVSIADLTKGAKAFNLTSPTDKFSIIATKNEATGYNLATGATIPSSASGSLSVDTPAGGLNKLSDDTDPYVFNSPRSIGVSTNPNAPNFGTTYVGNTQFNTANPVSRTNLPKGFYALRADGSDAFGQGNTALNPTSQDGFTVVNLGPNPPVSANDPYRMTVGADGTVYAAGFYDQNSNVWAMTPNLSSATTLLSGYNGPSPVPSGQNHGSVVSVAQTGSLATNNLVLYTLDEDLTTAAVTGGGDTADGFSVWKYTLTGPVPGPTPAGYTTMPTKVADHVSPNAGNTFSDMDRGADGKIYMSVNPNAANPATTRLIVTDPNGVKLFDSLTASTSLGAPSDIIANLNQIAVSPDQKWLAGMLNFTDVLVLPLVNGIPDLANRLVVDAGNVNSGRDIAFDAADNIHFVSSGIARYVVLSPAGNLKTTLSWDGSTYSFANGTVAPAGLLGDYNGNGKVDMGDYVLWRNGGTLQNEGASPGVNDAADYAFWKAHFGEHLGSGSGLGGSAVPEPTSAVLMLIGGVFACVAGGRKGR